MDEDTQIYENPQKYDQNDDWNLETLKKEVENVSNNRVDYYKSGVGDGSGAGGNA